MEVIKHRCISKITQLKFITLGLIVLQGLRSHKLQVVHI